MPAPLPGFVYPLFCATAAWDRYLASFTHPVPEWFQKRVDTRNTN
ncbi:DUF3613 domain-containing protein [Achromobacter sp. DMS1]|nr:DUF3613 domain-containing protein [Achromobacter sp. DMS1]